VVFILVSDYIDIASTSAVSLELVKISISGNHIK